MKGCTVFNVEQIEGWPAHYYAKPERRNVGEEARVEALERFFRNTGAVIRYGGNRAYYAAGSPIMCRCRPSSLSMTPKPFTGPFAMRCAIGRNPRPD